MVELYLHSPNTSSWSSAYLIKHKDNFTFNTTLLDTYIANYIMVLCRTHPYRRYCVAEWNYAIKEVTNRGRIKRKK
jgi:hypothetical protein